MSERRIVIADAVSWAMCLVLAAAAIALGPIYILSELGSASKSILETSTAASREILALIHVVFIGLIIGLSTDGMKKIRSRMTGFAIVFGFWELIVASAAVALKPSAGVAPPNMILGAMGLLLVMGGIALNFDSIMRKVTGPKTPIASIFAVATIAGVACFAMIGVLNARYYARVDYTHAGRYSLRPETIELLENVDKRIKITTLFMVRNVADDTLRREASDILEEFARTTSLVDVKHIDLRRDVKATAELAQRLAQQDVKLEENSVVFESPDTGRIIKVSAHEMLQVVRRDTLPTEAAPKARPAEEYKFFGENAFHQALSLVSSTERTKVYFLIGHGEQPATIGEQGQQIPPEVYQKFSNALNIDYLRQGLQLRYHTIDTIDLDNAENGIPDDCDVLVVLGPWMPYAAMYWEKEYKPFTSAHAQMIKQYLDRGGRALFVIDAVGEQNRRRIQPLTSMLGEYGVNIIDTHIILDEIMEPQRTPYGVVMVPRPMDIYPAQFKQNYDQKGVQEYHPAIRSLVASALTMVASSEVRPVRAPGYRQTPILFSTDRAWLLQVLAQEIPDPETQERRVRSMAVAVERENGEPVMIVTGSSLMFAQPYIRFENMAVNDEYAQKAIAWLAGSDSGITPRLAEQAYGNTNGGTIAAIRFLSILVIPSIFILAGAVIWFGRRD